MFDCGICFDVLDDPTTCSNCKTRFCYDCLSRVLTSSSTHGSAKCPTCRNTFTSNDLTRDTDFQKFMETQAGVPCPNHGCKENVPLTQLKKHEAECPHILMKCKYASYGCSWTGPKMHLNHHYQSQCQCEKISGLIEKYRDDSKKNKMYISHIQKQVRNFSCESTFPLSQQIKS